MDETVYLGDRGGYVCRGSDSTNILLFSPPKRRSRRRKPASIHCVSSSLVSTALVSIIKIRMNCLNEGRCTWCHKRQLPPVNRHIGHERSARYSART